VDQHTLVKEDTWYHIEGARGGHEVEFLAFGPIRNTSSLIKEPVDFRVIPAAGVNTTLVCR